MRKRKKDNVKCLAAIRDGLQSGKEAFWIGVDLDGTLAVWRNNQEIGTIGKPIKPMIERVKKWIREGKTVSIVTARVEIPGQKKLIQDWLEENGLPRLEVTNKKDWKMLCLYDDRAVKVFRNTGKLKR